MPPEHLSDAIDLDHVDAHGMGTHGARF
jgi:hypothetical protein